MTPPIVRKRKFHRRSKGGCKKCKSRHVRCDERQPLWYVVQDIHPYHGVCVLDVGGASTLVYFSYQTSDYQTNSTNCLQSGSDCVYPSTHTSNLEVGDAANPMSASTTPQASAMPASVIGLTRSVNNYTGTILDQLPEASYRLLHRFSQVAVMGERPVEREMQSSTILRAFANPGFMHVCLMFSACQWAWVTGSMDSVRMPFLYHKAETYNFVRTQLEDTQKCFTGDTMLAISALALSEAAIGDLDASSKHLKGFKSAMERQRSGTSLPQKILKRSRQGIRIGLTGPLVNTADYQPTFLALLFSSIWDISTLPPTEAPKYGWWEETDTPAARTWQSHTKHLNLDYEISRGFDPNQYIPRILNGDPRSSRTCFIATFFYLFSELGDGRLDAMLLGWLLEQLIEDVNRSEEVVKSDPSHGPLWLWCIMFGAAIANNGKATNAVEEEHLKCWKQLYADKIKLASHLLEVKSWHVARRLLDQFLGGMDQDLDRGLMELWEEAAGPCHIDDASLINVDVIELE